MKGTIAVADLMFFLMRQPISDPTAIPGVDLVRLQKRLLHLVAQRIELALGSGNVRLSSVASALRTGGEDLAQWSAGKSRNQSADLLRQELIRKFQAKSGGFVTGFRNADNEDLKGVPGAKSNSAAVSAAAQYVTAYMCKAAEMMMITLSKQRFKHLSFFFDAATVGKWNATCMDCFFYRNAFVEFGAITSLQ